ncbi:predicted protein [Chaetoceros tenuissimus]|uniref:Uncharacterized protein n=1 Tax=Chaetoceros tenuissimus TaxID=426638 RepID=A0AAD3CTC6_9STRA|nr:predicted protein [Chaetoceros tenuissimus]
MGLFKKLLRPLATTIQEPPHQHNVLKKSKKNGRKKEKFSHHIDGKENFNPVKQKANNSNKRNKKDRSGKEKKKPFWKKNKNTPQPAPKLSLFLAQDAGDNGSTIVTSSVTASLSQTSSRHSLATKSLSSSTNRSSIKSIASKDSQSNLKAAPKLSAFLLQEDKQKGIKETIIKPILSSQASKNEQKDEAKTETLSKERKVKPLTSTLQSPSSPLPEGKTPKQKSPDSPKSVEAVDDLMTINSSAVIFDNLSVQDSANEDLRSTGSLDTFQTIDSSQYTMVVHITNMKQLPLFSKLSSVNTLADADESGKRYTAYRSSTGDLAVVHDLKTEPAKTKELELKTVKKLPNDASDLQDIIDDIENDMRELKSILGSTDSIDSFEDLKTDAKCNSSWLLSTTIQDDSSSSSLLSFSSDDFKEDDETPQKMFEMTNISKLEMTTIVEEREEENSSVDPIEAALKRGVCKSQKAGENGDRSSQELPLFETKPSIKTSKSDTQVVVASAQTRPTRGALRKSSARRQVNSERTMTKRISWKAENEVHVFDLPCKINLERALNMVRSYDPRYKKTDTNAIKEPVKEDETKKLSRNDVQRPLQSILRTSKSYNNGRPTSRSSLKRSLTNPDISISDESSVASQRSRQSSTSTFSSTSTSESVQYMVAKLKGEADRRKRKVKKHRENQKLSDAKQ